MEVRLCESVERGENGAVVERLRRSVVVDNMFDRTFILHADTAQLTKCVQLTDTHTHNSAFIRLQGGPKKPAASASWLRSFSGVTVNINVRSHMQWPRFWATVYSRCVKTLKKNSKYVIKTFTKSQGVHCAGNLTHGAVVLKYWRVSIAVQGCIAAAA